MIDDDDRRFRAREALRSSFSLSCQTGSFSLGMEGTSGMADSVDEGVEEAVLEAVSDGTEEESPLDTSDSELGIFGRSNPSPSGPFEGGGGSTGELALFVCLVE